MKKGDIVIFQNNNKIVKTRVTHILTFNDFGEAFDKLGSQLVPIHNINRDKVIQLYSQYFSSDDIANNGVVAIGIKIIS